MKLDNNNLLLISVLFISLVYLLFPQSDSFSNNENNHHHFKGCECKKCDGPFIGSNYNHFSNKNGCMCQNKENFTSCHNEHKNQINHFSSCHKEHKDQVNHFSSCHKEHKDNLDHFTSCHNEHKDQVNHFSSCHNEHKDQVNHFSSCHKEHKDNLDHFTSCHNEHKDQVNHFSSCHNEHKDQVNHFAGGCGSDKYLENKEQFISENINRNRNIKNPCTDYLSDTEFLEHMIPHHQVAIDMSVDLMKVTKSPIMKNICRKIIWQQRYEITMMNAIMNKLPLPGSERKKMFGLGKSKLAYHEPKNTTSDGECDPLFFKPDDHKKHMEHMDLTDKSYQIIWFRIIKLRLICVSVYYYIQRALI